MTAKEKATRLVNSFWNLAKVNPDYSVLDNAKKCAHVAVDEILEDIKTTILYYHQDSRALNMNKHFWEAVKQEIEKL